MHERGVFSRDFCGRATYHDGFTARLTYCSTCHLSPPEACACDRPAG